jgi:hypothetical protein
MRRETRERLESAARAIFFAAREEGAEGIPWRQAVEQATEAMRCGARTRYGLPCRRLGLPRNGRCCKHSGLSSGPKSPEFRQYLRARMVKMNRTPEARERSRQRMYELNALRLGVSKAETRGWPDMKLKRLDDILKFPKYHRSSPPST